MFDTDVVVFHTTPVNLERFGFTPTETRVYEALLRRGPSTGYAIANVVGIARANAYQALDGLVRRGAARRAAAVPVQFSAIPPGVLVAELERSFRRDLIQLEDTLRSVTPTEAVTAPSPMTVTDPEVFLDHAAEICRAARNELQVVMGPWASSLIAPIAIARGRGATARVVSLGSPAPEGAVLRPVPVAEVRSYWGGLPVLVLADRIHAACGILGERGEAAGLVTASPAIAPFLRHLLRREIASAS